MSLSFHLTRFCLVLAAFASVSGIIPVLGRSANEYCARHQTCNSCQDAIEYPCGWCESNGSCEEGDLFGPFKGSCSDWRFFDCPSTTTTAVPSTATPTPSTPSPTGSAGHNFTFWNLGYEPLWIAILGNPGFATLGKGGFALYPAAPPEFIQVPVGWQGRIWARTACNFTAANATQCDPPYQPCCAAGSCLQADGSFGLHCSQSGVAPTSLIEFSLDNPSPVGPYDVYDVSLVDGWSAPLGIEPILGTYNPTPDPGVTSPWCQFTGCDAAPACPSPLAVNGTTSACWSPCQAAVNQHDRHHLIDRACCVCTQSHPNCNCASSLRDGSHHGCCKGGYGCTPYHTPPYPSDTVCDPWSNKTGRGWSSEELDYIDVVRSTCSQVYSWQFDDKAATFQCRKTDGLVDYKVTFVTRLR